MHLLQHVLYIFSALSVCKQFTIEYTHYVVVLLAGKMSISDVRKLYFRVRNDVFMDARAGISFDTDALEKILQNVVGKEMRMSDVTYPR